MPNILQPQQGTLFNVLSLVIGDKSTQRLFQMIKIEPRLLNDSGETVSRVLLAQALNMVLFSRNQAAVTRVVSTSQNPLNAAHLVLLGELSEKGKLPTDKAIQLLPALINCFNNQYDIPALSDYETLLAEFAEMAWIATEGNSFNHATSRVSDVFKLADEQRTLGRSIKDKIEVSADGRVRQTAFKAAQVKRSFRHLDGPIIQRTVPGSFYEFITRDFFPADESGHAKIALHFDTSNAQGIFKMTDASVC